ncbi:MAG: hypothetical protein AB2693_23445, partial [Candidatus Thiodiazotropha sp.]
MIIRLQGLSWSASAMNIRTFFKGLNIPPGGVHIIGGEKGDAFIAFSTDEDARQAMMMTNGMINDSPVQLFLSSKSEMQNTITKAKEASSASVPAAAPPMIQKPTPSASPLQQSAQYGVSNTAMNVPGANQMPVNVSSSDNKPSSMYREQALPGEYAKGGMPVQNQYVDPAQQTQHMNNKQSFGIGSQPTQYGGFKDDQMFYANYQQTQSTSNVQTNNQNAPLSQQSQMMHNNPYSVQSSMPSAYGYQGGLAGLPNSQTPGSSGNLSESKFSGPLDTQKNFQQALPSSQQGFPNSKQESIANPYLSYSNDPRGNMAYQQLPYGNKPAIQEEQKGLNANYPKSNFGTIDSKQNVTEKYPPYDSQQKSANNVGTMGISNDSRDNLPNQRPMFDNKETNKDSQKEFNDNMRGYKNKYGNQDMYDNASMSYSSFQNSTNLSYGQVPSNNQQNNDNQMAYGANQRGPMDNQFQKGRDDHFTETPASQGWGEFSQPSNAP